MLESVDWKFVGAAVSAAFGFYKYLTELAKDREQREREIKDRRDQDLWQRTRWLFELSHKFYDDADVRACTQLLDEEKIDEKKANELRLALREPISVEQASTRLQFNRMLAQLDDIATLLDRKLFQVQDAYHLGFYFQLVDENRAVREYAEANGFGRVLWACDMLRTYHRTMKSEASTATAI